MINNHDHPFMWGVPHDEWRQYQLETVKWILKEQHRMLLIEAPVGSGKSAVGSALGSRGIVRVLTNAKNLQEQYEKVYDFQPIYGLANYPCVLSTGVMDLMADDCAFPMEMHVCPVYHECAYVIARDRCSRSRRQVMNYPYYKEASWVDEKKSNYLYLDEAHLIPDMLKSYSTVEFTVEYLRDNNLPMFPTTRPANKNIRLRIAAKWLDEIGKIYKQEYNKIANIPKAIRSVAVVRKMNFLENEIRVIDDIIRSSTDYPELYFADWSTDSGVIRVVPLSVSRLFSHYFNEGDKIILTSATIGNPAVFSKILGIKNYGFRAVPSVFPPESMPIYIPDDAPRMNAKAGKAKLKKWGMIVGDMIKLCDPSWSGVVHVSSYFQAKDLAERLSAQGLGNRVYIPTALGTENKVKEVEQRVRKFKNPIIISPSFHEGLDAPYFGFNILAKIPFKALDSWGYAEMEFDPTRYRWDAAAKSEQACGRIRRGEPEHYESIGEPRRKFVGIADGNISIISGELSDFFKSCMTTL